MTEEEKRNNAKSAAEEERPDSAQEPAEAQEANEAVSDEAENDAGKREKPPSLEDQLEAVRHESREHYNRYLRSVADMENYRRRVARDKEELRRYATSSLIEDLLPALDNLLLGIKSAESHPEAKGVVDGFTMVADQIRGILDQHGLKEIDPEGADFDPHHHECVAHEPSDEIEEGRIMKVVRKGYRLHDRLVRPAAVVVSSGAAPRADAETKKSD